MARSHCHNIILCLKPNFKSLLIFNFDLYLKSLLENILLIALIHIYKSYILIITLDINFFVLLWLQIITRYFFSIFSINYPLFKVDNIANYLYNLI